MRYHAYFFCSQWPINQNGKTDRKQLIASYKIQNKNKISWQAGDSAPEKIIYDCLIARNKPFGSAEDSLISFGWNSIELLSLANELNMKGIFVPLTSFIQNPSIQFILSAENKEANDNLVNPLEEDFDIDDILNVLND